MRSAGEDFTYDPIRNPGSIICYIPEKRIILGRIHLNAKLYLFNGQNYGLLRSLWVGSKIRNMQYASLRGRLYVSTDLRILEVDLKAPSSPAQALLGYSTVNGWSSAGVRLASSKLLLLGLLAPFCYEYERLVVPNVPAFTPG